MKVFLTRPLFNTDDLISQLQQADIECICREEDTPCPRDMIADQMGQVDVMITHTEDVIDAELLESAAPDLKLIANVGIGYSNIDIEAASARKITVTNTPTEEAFAATAEATVALLLAVARRIPALHMERSQLSQDPDPSFLRPTAVEVRNKITGIVGMGRIGSRVAETLYLGFNHQILYFDSYAKPELESQLGARQVDLATLMRESDFVCINMPLSDSSRGVVSEEMISLLKDSATVINTARAELIDEMALIERFNTGRLHGIGLDVYSDKAAAAIRGDNYALTSHFCNFEDRAYQAMTQLVIDNILAIAEDKPAITGVN